MRVEDCVAVDFHHASRIADNCTGCSLCARYHLKSRGYTPHGNSGCNQGAWACVGIVWLTKVEYKGETLIGAKQADASAHARKLGVEICELCPLRGQPECNNGPYNCHGIVWMHEKEFVVMELTR